jgi:F0F1-type ATP synthase membrane subunit c/vacuolar-type H+-ATPase subunit K
MEKAKKSKIKSEYYIGIGLCFGVAFGAAFDNIGLGICLGLVFGAAISMQKRNSNK